MVSGASRSGWFAPGASSAATSRQSGIFLCYLLVLIWAPIPIGSNRPWSLALLETGVLGIAGCLALGYALRPYPIPAAARQAALPMLLLGAWAIYPLVQMMPLPLSWSPSLGPGGQAPYASTLPGGEPVAAYLSVDRGATFTGFLWQTALVCQLACTLMLATTGARVRAILWVLFMVGFAQALYGLLIFFGGEHLGLWNPGYADGAVSGTYVNQNHFAGLMELTIPVGLGLLLYSGPEWHGDSAPSGLVRRVVALLTGRGGVIVFCTVVMMAALMLTTSRGGVGGLACGVFVAIAIAVAGRGVRTREFALGFVVILLALVALLWIGPGGMAEKIETAGLGSKRGDLRDTSYEMIADRPVFGSGVGTYRWVFPLYKDERFGGNFYEHAHNDFLEVLGEQGAIGFALLVAGLGIFLARIARKFMSTRDPMARGALFAVIGATVAILVHGLVDFNLHIPANALVFVTLVGVGASVPGPDADGSREGGRR